MKRRHNKFEVLGLVLSTIALIIAIVGGTVQGVSAQAQATGSGQALEIGPPVINLVGDPGQVLTTQLSIRDVSNGKLLVSSQVNDFGAAGENGTPKLVLDDTTNQSEPSPYSIKSWVTPPAELLLEPKQLKRLPLTINVPANAAPGGYYGVVRFTAKAPDSNTTGVALSASLGALIFIRINGDAKEQMKSEQLFVSKNEAEAKPASFFETSELKITERIRNQGNVHEQPTGTVIIKDMFGKNVGTVNVNMSLRNVLPGSIRKFEQPIDKTVIGNKKLFGRYTATMDVTYGTGNKKQTLTESTTFWVIPYKLILALVIALIGGFFALRYGLRRYNKRILSKAYGSRRK